jgi:hypothetical protein
MASSSRIRLPGLRRLAGADLRHRVAGVDDALDQDFDLAAALLAAEEARPDHARIVEHQQIAGCEQRRKLSEAAVVQAAPSASCSSRLAVRSAVGCWAISSPGRSKSKSSSVSMRERVDEAVSREIWRRNVLRSACSLPENQR